MNFIYLLLSAVGESGGYVFDRLNYKRNHISFRDLMFLGFLAMAIFIVPYVLLTDQPTPDFSPAAITLIALIIGFSFLGNVFDSLSLKANDLSVREPLLDFYPILAGLVGFALFPDERSPGALLAFIAGTITVYWGLHRVKLGKLQRKGIWFLLLSIALYALLPSLYQEALAYLSPAYIAAFRVVGILVLVTLFLRPKSVRGFTPKGVWYCFLAGAFCAVAAIASLYAIQAYGVVLTMLFFMLGPALRYLAGQFILHEKVRRTEVVSSLILSVIVAIVVFAQ